MIRRRLPIGIQTFREIRERDCYYVDKTAWIRRLLDEDKHYFLFSFLTGVSKFSKVSLFSGLNNVTDITLDPHYSAICGYTEADLDTVFAPELPGLDRDEVRDWYNGYGWRTARTTGGSTWRCGSAAACTCSSSRWWRWRARERRWRS